MRKIQKIHCEFIDDVNDLKTRGVIAVDPVGSPSSSTIDEDIPSARESSYAASRPAGGFRADYGFVATMDREIMRDPERDVGHGITDSCDEIVETLDRHAHAYTCHLMETEARMSREAWVRATDASDLVHGEVISLRTTVLGRISEIRELQAADRRRQNVISELLSIDHRRSTKILELRSALQG
nr:hypothetical protein [Tanacetum cinerariifolium]